MADLVTELKGFADKVAGAVKDLATIDVVTLTGEIKLEILGTGSDVKIDPTALFEKLQGKVDGSLSVVALTHVEIDMDVTNFGSATPSDALFSLHQQSVKNAIEARAAVLDMIKGLIKSL